MEKEQFETILKKTWEALKAAYENNLETEGSNILSTEQRLVFPLRRGKDVGPRVSEQELRFEFIHQMLRMDDNKWWYSIETPTKNPYSGFATGDPKLDERGESGAVDTMLFDASGKRVCLIEFKANNPGKSDYSKDFVKMNHEEVPNNYFVQLLERATASTFDSIIEKIDGEHDADQTDRKINTKTTLYYCIVLGSRDNNSYKSPGIYYYDGNVITPLSCQ